MGVLVLCQKAALEQQGAVSLVDGGLTFQPAQRPPTPLTPSSKVRPQWSRGENSPVIYHVTDHQVCSKAR